VSSPLVRASARMFPLFIQSLCEPRHRSPRILGGPAGDFFATQIAARISASC
jgi:hypothetical protein